MATKNTSRLGICGLALIAGLGLNACDGGGSGGSSDEPIFPESWRVHDNGNVEYLQNVPYAQSNFVSNDGHNDSVGYRDHDNQGAANDYVDSMSGGGDSGSSTPSNPDAPPEYD